MFFSPKLRKIRHRDVVTGIEYVRILFKILPVSSKCNLSLIDHIAQVDMLSFSLNQIVL